MITDVQQLSEMPVTIRNRVERCISGANCSRAGNALIVN